MPAIEDPVSFTPFGGLFSAKLTVKGYPKELKYQLNKIKMSKDAVAENSLIDRTKDKKFMRLDTIFDFIDANFRIK